MKAALADEDWTVSFKALDDLRIVNKFHTNDLAERLDYLSPMIKSGVENLRSNISKNALTFCKEVLENKGLTGEAKYKEQMLVFMRATLPSLLGRT